MKKKIRVKFVDWSPGLDITKTFVYRALSQFYELEESGNPDYLFDGGLGLHHLKYDCIKVLLLGENLVPDFNNFDYAIGFDFISFGDRYVRIPFCTLSDNYVALYNRVMPSDDMLLNRAFCSFVVSNGKGDPLREKFFRRLSEYKPVASGGRWMNNVGGPVKNKLDFCSRYKFNICFENSPALGYTTEKIMDAFAANSVPIYYGNPLITVDFSSESIVCLKGDGDIERVVEEIVRLDNDNDSYLKKCKAYVPTYPHPMYCREKEILFLRHIIDQPLEKAMRLNRYGYQATQRRRTKYALLAHQFARDSFWFVYELLHGQIRRIKT